MRKDTFMKTAIQTWSLRDLKEDASYSVFTGLDKTAEMGFTGTEIMVDDLENDNPDYLKKVVDYARQKGITVDAFFVFNDFANIREPEKRLADIENIKKWLNRAGKAGVPVLSMLSGIAIEGEPKERLRQAIMDAFKQVAPVAEQAGVTMVIENFGGIVYFAEEMVSFINELGSQRLRISIDSTNWLKDEEFFVENPSRRDSELLYENAGIAAPLMANAHVKIKGVHDDGTLIGYGDDLTELLTIYRDAGYRGPLQFESIADGDLLEPIVKAKKIIDAAISRLLSI